MWGIRYKTDDDKIGWCMTGGGVVLWFSCKDVARGQLEMFEINKSFPDCELWVERFKKKKVSVYPSLTELGLL